MKARFLGQHLLASGAVSAQQLLAALDHQAQSNAKLGNHAVSLGLATPFEVEQIRALQAVEDVRFGDAAIRLGILDGAQLDRVLAAREKGHVSLGDAMIALGYLTREQVEAAAAEFLTSEARIEAEVVTIPDDLPHRELAFELFHLAHKLLLRVCDVEAKTERLRVMNDVFPLAECNARITLSGAFQTSILFCIPLAVATDVAARYSGEEPPTDLDVEIIACDLAALLARNLQSVMAQRGKELTVSEPEMLGTRLTLPPGRRVAVVPFLTHRGRILVSLTLPPTT